jgi:hypothetical protein
MSDEKGGRYVVNDKGERTLAEEPTRDHPEGNAPRPAPAETEPAAGPSGKTKRS